MKHVTYLHNIPVQADAEGNFGFTIKQVKKRLEGGTVYNRDYVYQLIIDQVTDVKCQLKPKDKIIFIDFVKVHDMSLETALSHLRAKKMVKLSVTRVLENVDFFGLGS